MAKIIFGMLVVFAIFFFGIDAVRKMSGKAKLQLTKLAGYSILCSLLTTIAVATIVFLF